MSVWCVCVEGGVPGIPQYMWVWKPETAFGNLTPTPYFLRQVLLMKMELLTPARLAGLWAPGIHSFPLPHLQG